MIPVYVIHLPNPERREKIDAELKRVGFTDITYVHAKEPYPGFTMSNMRRNPRGEFGCALSHVKALTIAFRDWERDSPHNEALFIEDDVEFTDGVLERTSAAIEFLRDQYFERAIPREWELIYLGGHPRGAVEQIRDGLFRVGKFSCAEAYVFNLWAIPFFLEFWSDRIGQSNAMFDFILGEYAEQNYCGYAFNPSLTHQPPGWSHIGQKHDDKTHLYEKGWRENLLA